MGRAITVGAFVVRPARFEIADAVIDGLDLGTDGHIVCYLVEGDGRHCLLAQREWLFYQEEGAPEIASLDSKLKQGDGIIAPRWHKCDREWPVANGKPLVFCGQGYFDRNVIYLFRDPSSGRLAIFCDDVARQDAEEHYAEEDARMA